MTDSEKWAKYKKPIHLGKKFKQCNLECSKQPRGPEWKKNKKLGKGKK